MTTTTTTMMAALVGREVDGMRAAHRGAFEVELESSRNFETLVRMANFVAKVPLNDEAVHELFEIVKMAASYTGTQPTSRQDLQGRISD